MQGLSVTERNTCTSEFETISTFMPFRPLPRRSPRHVFSNRDLKVRSHAARVTAVRQETAPEFALRVLTAAVGAIAIASALVLAMAAVYIMKSALGINLFDGPSFLHEPLYWLVG